MNVKNFVKTHLCLTICTLGLSVVGYLGYHLVRCIVMKCKRTQKIDQVAQNSLQNKNLPPPPPANTDKHLITALQKQGFGKPLPNAANGNCLFLSIAPQIEGQDLEEACQQLGEELPLWNTLSEDEQADLLRAWAMRKENIFFKNLPEQAEELSNDDQEWLRECYKDFLQELEECPAYQIPERIQNTSLQAQLDYVKNNDETYIERTGRPKNWAGTAEYIALSRLFNRQITAYGYDQATAQNTIQYDANNQVQPYYRRVIGREPPITIFQCHGGGHYEHLPLKKNG